jgi:hypothetical protein
MDPRADIFQFGRGLIRLVVVHFLISMVTSGRGFTLARDLVNNGDISIDLSRRST